MSQLASKQAQTYGKTVFFASLFVLVKDFSANQAQKKELSAAQDGMWGGGSFSSSQIVSTTEIDLMPSCDALWLT